MSRVVRLALGLGPIALALVGACTQDGLQVRRNQKRVRGESAVAVGRFGLSTQRKVNADRFELVAVRIPEQTRINIPLQLEPDSDGKTAVFFVELPPGHYRLTKWTVASAARSYGGKDAGLALEIAGGEVACVGTMLLAPQEHGLVFAEEDAPPPLAEIRDDCPALVELLRERAPKLAERPLVKLARSVVAPRKR